MTNKKKTTNKAKQVVLDDLSNLGDLDFEVLDKKQLGKVVVAVAEQSKSHIGPLPQSEDFEKYEHTYKGAAKIILDYANHEQSHRHQMDEKMSSAAISDTKRGQALAFFTMLSLIISALVATWLGYEIAAGLFLAPVALGTVGKFIDGRDSSKKE